MTNPTQIPTVNGVPVAQFLQQEGYTFDDGAQQWNRPAAGAAPTQLATTEGMTPAQIADAFEAGQLNQLLGGEPR